MAVVLVFNRWRYKHKAVTEKDVKCLDFRHSLQQSKCPNSVNSIFMSRINLVISDLKNYISTLHLSVSKSGEHLQKTSLALENSKNKA